MPPHDTIAAIATAPGPGGVGIVRVSGPRALEIADALYRTPGRAHPKLPLSQRESHRVHPGWLVDGTGRFLDSAIVLSMRGPHSFTGEDVVEFQTHGGGAVPHAVLEAVLAAGGRLAAAGEFTKRAFLNGKLDLAQAEAVHDLVTARSERGLAQAVAQLDGALSRQVRAVRDETLGLLARIEAAIDYPDEIEDLEAGEALGLLARLEGLLARHLATAHEGQIAREGARLAIVGRPNAGKSSLLNALLGTDRAIVTAIAGTTRDVLEEGAVVGGVPFRLTDTAGLRTTLDPIEALGIARGKAALARADVVVLVVDLLAGVGALELELRAELAGRPLVLVGNKQDEADEQALAAFEAFAGELPHAAVSALTGTGMTGLARELATAALGVAALAPSETTINARHRASLEAARAAFGRAREAMQAGLPGDFWAIDLVAAASALGEVTGDALAEEVIEQVFARFCVGK